MNNDMTMDVLLWVIWILNLIWTIVNIVVYVRIKKKPTFEIIFHDDLTELESIETTFKGKRLPQIIPPLEMTGTIKGDITFFDGDIAAMVTPPEIIVDKIYESIGIWTCKECGHRNSVISVICPRSGCNQLQENQ